MNSKELSFNINNQKIYGKLYIPDESKKQPIVILAHGLSLNHTYMIPYAEKLYEKNIASYVFDFRGGGYESLSDGKISDMSLITEMEDYNFIIDQIKKEDFVDEDKIYVAGHSQGGLIASLIAPDRDDIKSLFLFAPAFEIPEDVKEYENQKDNNVLNLMPEHLGETYINAAKSINPFEIISGFKNDVLIFHGFKDFRVPVDYSIKADKIYDNSIVYLYEEGEHRFTDKIKDDVVNIISEHINSYK